MLLVSGLLVWQAFVHKRTNALSMPPSPPSNHWLWGHVLPKEYPFLQIDKWIAEYGPVITLRTGFTKHVQIGRQQALIDIMERQGTVLADRPHAISTSELFAQGASIGFVPAGERIKSMRRALHTYLAPRAAEHYEPLITVHARAFILDLLDNPYDFQEHAKTFSSSLVLQVAYGKDTLTRASDPSVQQVQDQNERLRLVMSPGAYLVDTIPMLKYLPWYARRLKDGFKKDKELFESHLDDIETKMNNGDPNPSFARHLLEHEEQYQLSRIDMAFLAGALFSAGSDTTATGICGILLSLALHQEEQCMVSEEMDRIVGTERVPVFGDEDSLPILRAFIAETIRWRPIAPLALAHKTTADVYWDKYCILAGTTVQGSIWASSRDPDFYSDPEKFDIKRWLTTRAFREDMKFLAFGYGRRACPGQHLANRSLLINTMLVVWSFHLSMSPIKDCDDRLYLSGFPHQRAYDLRFKSRMGSDTLRDAIRRPAILT
ncbi:cytochrome P450 [Coniophora puteana RWD-64-598 SS2]|uniref:Cytochrome P450 n=1 Tax=Coniophora puteana (strain RWD-64-598) TaxID=741705 RepID=A0A5M3MFR0_CONPW|nr:cytochrome P450 [Coniophora puteana RWD-64-598 SS2]EIW77877.1 cytochrome P450 [Coniophora puteana RWD-64-598 SS2]